MSLVITEEYRQANRVMHQRDPHWGRQARHHVEAVRELCTQAGTKRLLDYGCGKAELKFALEPDGFEVTCYDPGIPEYANTPEPHPFVTCLDVLEHIEPELIDNVILDLKRVVDGVGLFIISTRTAKRIMADGKPAHRLVRDADWWKAKLKPHFVLATIQKDKIQVSFLVGKQ